MIKTKVGFFFIIAIIGLFIVAYLDSKDLNYSSHDILVEFHGLIYDLFVFGIIITIYETIKSKKDRIIRYNEEIDDYRFLENEEIKYRIKGLVNRLIKLNATKINLSHCHIIGCPITEKMINWNFSNAKLYKSAFIDIDLSGTKFFHSDITETNFANVNLKNATFRLAVLNDCQFNNCNFENTDFSLAYVEDKDWFNGMIVNKNIGIESLLNKYIISSNTVSINSREYFQLIRKDFNKNKAEPRDKIIFESIKNGQPIILIN